MKIALCLTGLVGSKLDKNGIGESIPVKVPYNYYKEHILDHNDVDIFIHSWSVDHKDELLDVYKPKDYLIETQRTFDNAKRHKDLHSFNVILRDWALSPFNRAKVLEERRQRQENAFRIYSRWYSTQQVLRLKKDYETKNDFVYDCVMLSRLDLAFFTDVKFDEFDLDHFYASNWNDVPNADNGFVVGRQNYQHGLLDFWFFSNSSYMDQFGALYDHLEQYTLNSHVASKEHLNTITSKVKYVFYRWKDHEMVRRKMYRAIK